LRFDALVQPVLDRHCITCHDPGADKPDLSGQASYASLLAHGQPTLREQIVARYRAGASPVGVGAARESALMSLLADGHHGVELDEDDRDRLVTWLDTYAQRLGSFSDDQEARLVRLREAMAPILTR
jgi:hypothetical protein